MLYNLLMEKQERIRFNLTISFECHRIMSALAKKLGLSRTAIVELAVRQMAKTEQVE
jgi:hypothetical protein